MPDTAAIQRANYFPVLLKVKFKYVKNIYLFLFLSLSSLYCAAQPMQEKVQMADGLRSNGKIYVVVAVLLTVLAGLIIYVITVDRRISRLEKQNQL